MSEGDAMSDLDQKGLEAASMAAMWGHDLSKEERAERIVRAYLASAAPEKDEPASRSEEDGWRPIETAPKDGTFIIVYYRMIGSPFGNCHWIDVVRWASFGGGPEAWLDTDDLVSCDPTHWRPLPPPPALATGEGK